MKRNRCFLFLPCSRIYFSLVLLFTSLSLLIYSSSYAGSYSATVIEGYHPIFKPFYNERQELKIAIRQYRIGSVSHLLILDPFSFETTTVLAQQIIFRKEPPPEDRLKSTPFIGALSKHTSPPYPYQNDGVVQADHPVNGMFLTIDLCPSKRFLDKILFEKTMSLLPENETTVPIAVAITGTWIKQHKSDFQWLTRTTSGRLQITWINHSYSHLYPSRTITTDTELEKEALLTEMMLLEHGLMPSPFFRFPGLISNQKLIEKLKQLSLIPLGSNAWLSKGQCPENGCIILVHGNGNDPRGVKMLFSLYDKQMDHSVHNDPFLLPLKYLFISYP